MDQPNPNGNWEVLSQGRTYYEIHGHQEGEVILCMHGITLSSFIFKYIVQDLIARGKYKVVTFDFYGRGKTDAANVDNNLELFVGQAHELVTKLGLSKMVVIGVSMGGAVSSVFTSRYPELVKKLILIAPAVAPVDLPFLGRLVTYPYIGSTLYYFLGQRIMLSRLEKERLRDNYYSPEKYPEFIEEAVNNARNQILHHPGFVRSFHNTLCTFPLQLGVLEHVGKISPQIPVLILWGENDTVTPISKAPMVIDILKNSGVEVTLISLKDAGHMCMMDQQELVHNAIFDFIERPLQIS
eukprot:TRINITY_DN946_c0_g1_i2.p1 TRINITY_DN946_c0_g1~~TRINITY_DN946_c0_g1_i2.p1  ORF type:complete len:297 (+),score=56.94 TRINITY_DN946_c0_g1_i2:649-1539(+)